MNQPSNNEYALHIGFKTKFLNLFRRLFQLPFLERFLIRQIQPGKSNIWKKLVPPDYLYKKGSVRRTSVDGVEFQLDISNVVEHLVYFRVTPENFKPVEEVIKSAKVIFDVGANIGSTALYFAMENPGAKIFSFEPQPETFEKAKKNIALNSFKNIRLFNIGLGEKATSLKLYQVIDNNPAMNRIMPGEHDFPFTMVQINTLDEFCNEQRIQAIDFIKIDVEGYEYFVLKGGYKIITISHPVIYLELYDHGLKKHGYSAAGLVELLYEMGYTNITNAYNLSPVDTTTDLIDCDIDIIAVKENLPASYLSK